MESIVPEDTPLGSLLEGEGQNGGERAASERSSSPEPHVKPSFAPSASRIVRSRLRASSLGHLQVKIPHSRKISQAKEACSRAINMQIGSSTDAHFLEHFRYIVIASQLLDESPDHGVLHAARKAKAGAEEGDEPETTQNTTGASLGGAVMTAAVALMLVCLIKWGPSGKLKTNKVVAIAMTLPLVVIGLVYYGRKQFSRCFRQQAVDAASKLTNSLQSFELVSSSALALIQEVELVAKGYRFSSPLPPVSRLDDAKTLRRCMPLRRHLCRVYTELLQTLVEAHTQLQPHVNFDDYIKYLDVYDMPRSDIQDCMATRTSDDIDPESLGTLRVLGFRVSVMRRAFLCDLLSLEANNDADDRIRWCTATETAETLFKATSAHTRALASSLSELEDFAVPPSPRPNKHGNDRLKTQVRKISNLSTGIRSLQAKMTLLREESNAALSSADDLADLGPTLMSQYDSIGADINSLLADWEAGKSALTTNIIKHERRISMASSNGIRSPCSSSFHGLASVDEGGPADALRALTGEWEGSVSPRSSMPSTPRDEEVFEAIAMPKQRSHLTREERIRLMQEERVKAEERKEMRDSGVNMMKELKTVIGVRKRGRADSAGARVTSI